MLQRKSRTGEGGRGRRQGRQMRLLEEAGGEGPAPPRGVSRDEGPLWAERTQGQRGAWVTSRTADTSVGSWGAGGGAQV